MGLPPHTPFKRKNKKQNSPSPFSSGRLKALLRRQKPLSFFTCLLKNFQIYVLRAGKKDLGYKMYRQKKTWALKIKKILPAAVLESFSRELDKKLNPSGRSRL
jgi:hypothetical protein